MRSSAAKPTFPTCRAGGQSQKAGNNVHDCRGSAVMNAKCRGYRRLKRSGWIAVSITQLTAGCSPQASTRSDVIRPVKTAVVTAGEEPHVRSFPGKVEASKKVELAFQVSGLLVNFSVNEGQKVAKG